MLGVRVFGPADLYEKDQPKTLAYTADVVLQGRYSLPRDVLYQPATKPPLYNWISAAVVKATGSWDEWALKFPSLLGSLATGAIVFVMARRLHPDRSIVFASLAGAIWFTFGSDVRHGSVIRMGYLARPDMLQCAFMTAAWACATVMLQKRCTTEARRLGADNSIHESARIDTNENKNDSHAFSSLCASVSPWCIFFWLSVTGAILTKGPAALMVIVYALALSILTTRRFAWLAGAPIAIVLAGAWLWCAYQQDPTHVRETILGAEVLDRVTDESPEGISKPVYYSVMWFITKAFPWGAVALAGGVIWCFFRRRDRTMLPAVLWMGIVLAMLSIPAGKRMDYLLPAYAPGAIVAAYGIMRFVSWVARLLARSRGSLDRANHGSGYQAVAPVFPLLVAIALAYLHLTRFHESREHWSDRAVAFAETVRPIVGSEPCLVIVRGKHPIPVLLGRHQGSFLTPEDLSKAAWVILPEQPDRVAQAVSEPIPIGFETLETRALARLALYRTQDAGLSLDRLIEQQKQVGTWTKAENPYRAPGTVFRDAKQ